MKTYRVIETTDGQFLGLVYKWSNPLLDNTDLQITESVIFHIQKQKK